ncbi:hypothetical protein ASG93_12970 [Paenibacillus sp. Soil787]|nr:hypothetical protein ASG93_12970 [Paenibacillus sp. Soil787]
MFFLQRHKVFCCLIIKGNTHYAFYKRIFGEEGNLATIALYQCESIPGRTDIVDILKAALS